MENQGNVARSYTSSDPDKNTGSAADSTVQQAREKAGEYAEQAKKQVTTQLAGQKERATEELDSIGQALHSTSDHLREENQGMIADYVEQAAEQVSRLAGHLRNHSVSELLNEAERFARREPALFLGGAALLGIVGARFFKSSQPSTGDYSRGYSSRPYPAYETRSRYGDSYGRTDYRSSYAGSSGTRMEGATWGSEARPAGTGLSESMSSRTEPITDKVRSETGSSEGRRNV